MGTGLNTSSLLSLCFCFCSFEHEKWDTGGWGEGLARGIQDGEREQRGARHRQATSPVPGNFSTKRSESGLS